MVVHEQPDAANAVIQPAGLIDSALNWIAPAYMSTNGSTGEISYYPKSLEGLSTQEIADLLTHELTHRKQVLTNSVIRGGEDYWRRPSEIAAYESQVRRAVGQGRGTSTPSFETGQDVYQTDTFLPSMRRQSLLQQLKK